MQIYLRFISPFSFLGDDDNLLFFHDLERKFYLIRVFHFKPN